MCKSKLTFGYLKLIKKVKKHDRDAALYLLNEAPLFTNFKASKKLCQAFAWNGSPQGHDYWSNLEDAIGQFPGNF